MRGEVDIAAHSAKDLPTQLPDEIAILGYLPREDVRDAWISPHAPHPRGLAAGSVVGTASLRRGAMIKRLRPDLAVRLLRGNVETRLAKVAAGEVDATLLALAGLRRLGLEAKATAILDAERVRSRAGAGRDRHYSEGGRRERSLRPRAGSRRRDGARARRRARVPACPRRVLQDADRRLRASRRRKAAFPRHRVEAGRLRFLRSADQRIR